MPGEETTIKFVLEDTQSSRPTPVGTPKTPGTQTPGTPGAPSVQPPAAPPATPPTGPSTTTYRNPPSEQTDIPYVPIASKPVIASAAGGGVRAEPEVPPAASPSSSPEQEPPLQAGGIGTTPGEDVDRIIESPQLKEINDSIVDGLRNVNTTLDDLLKAVHEFDIPKESETPAEPPALPKPPEEPAPKAPIVPKAKRGSELRNEIISEFSVAGTLGAFGLGRLAGVGQGLLGEISPTLSGATTATISAYMAEKAAEKAALEEAEAAAEAATGATAGTAAGEAAIRPATSGLTTATNAALLGSVATRGYSSLIKPPPPPPSGRGFTTEIKPPPPPGSSEPLAGIAAGEAAVPAEEAAAGLATKAAVGGGAVSLLGKAKALMMAHPVGAAIGIATVTILAGVEALKKLNQVVSDTAESIKDLSPDVAVAESMREVRLMQAHLERSRRIGPQLGEYVKAQTDLAVEMAKFRTVFAENITPQMTALNEGMAKIVHGTTWLFDRREHAGLKAVIKDLIVTGVTGGTAPGFFSLNYLVRRLVGLAQDNKDSKKIDMAGLEKSSFLDPALPGFLDLPYKGQPNLPDGMW